MAAFATADSLFVRLGVETPDSDHPSFLQADAALEDASDELRSITGQDLTAATSTFTETVPVGQLVNLSVVPVRAVESVVDADTGAPVPYVLDNPKQMTVRAPAGTRVKITCTHGWIKIPGDIQKWTRVLAAAQMVAADAGNLGLSGGIAGVGVDDGRVTFATNRGEAGQGVDIPESVQARLRHTYGSVATTVEHRA